MSKITFIGGGNMASAIIGGLISRGAAASDLHVIDPEAARLAELATRYGVTGGSPDDALPTSDVVVLAVKPQQLKAVSQHLAPSLGGALVISIAAGIRADSLSRWLGGHTRVVRVMPNTPALVQAGLSGAYAGADVDTSDRALADRVLGAIGEVVWVESEAEIDGITAISGSGPAYVFYFMEALQAAARAQGFNIDTARKLAYQTFYGAVKLALESEDDAGTLRAKVTSKGGTTERAINAFETSQLRATIIAAAAAAAARSRELGEELGRDAD
ncbi:pyrroline-5-carboxylate reductase [Chitiniphilus eburneus]|uniref:Pyrroline-5-carboxylate reductase n=1 Tax=Chitiniphilus eburneus TaxID=2571148 RepID=A0A4U0Q350_9NEIS|nr:pyrroline-5-carboxylate reductase [Chitiniphilus eburneus]TJZ75511.1 pyrroline-5-carboxylate reductase [Chitiniphilus eburneus]